MYTEQKIIKIIPGDVGWLILSLFIVSWDIYAVATTKAETMSSAIWRSLSHPKKFPLALTMWSLITWHLFFNPKAREAYRLIWEIHNPKLIRKVN